MRRISFRVDDSLNLVLTPVQVAACKERFAALDPYHHGSISRSDLKDLLEHLGESISDETMTRIYSFLDEEGVRQIDPPAVIKAISKLKEISQEEDDTDVDVCNRQIVNAFVAMGGNWDKSGVVKKSWIQKILVDVFGMVKVNIDKLLEEAGVEADEDLTFSDFNIFLTAGSSERASRIRSLFSLVSSTAT